jgi:hypothetical protein
MPQFPMLLFPQQQGQGCRGGHDEGRQQGGESPVHLVQYARDPTEGRGGADMR